MNDSHLNVYSSGHSIHCFPADNTILESRVKMVLSVCVTNQVPLPNSKSFTLATASPAGSGAQSAPVKLQRSSSIPFAVQVKHYANCQVSSSKVSTLLLAQKGFTSEILNHSAQMCAICSVNAPHERSFSQTQRIPAWHLPGVRMSDIVPMTDILHVRHSAVCQTQRMSVIALCCMCTGMCR